MPETMQQIKGRHIDSLRPLTAIASGKTVQGIVSLALSTDVAAEGVGLEGASVLARGVNVANVNLD